MHSLVTFAVWKIANLEHCHVLRLERDMALKQVLIDLRSELNWLLLT